MRRRAGREDREVVGEVLPGRDAPAVVRLAPAVEASGDEGHGRTVSASDGPALDLVAAADEDLGHELRAEEAVLDDAWGR